MGKPDIDKFIAELDAINDGPDRKKYKDNTRSLLGEGDAVFNASAIIQQRISDGTFQQTISGVTYVEETIDGTTFRRPVVDLVQQGGTMLGIGLLGYTYIMEKAGVRFRSMAGTSAGAINTLLLAALPQKIYQEKSFFFDDGRQAVKSEFLAHLVANKQFISFIDRRGLLGKLQCWLLNRIKMVGKVLNVARLLLPILILGLSALIYAGLNTFLFRLSNGLEEKEIKIYNFVLGTLGISAVILLMIFLVFALLKNTMGVNPGEKVYEWMKLILDTEYVGVRTTRDLLNSKNNETKPIHGTEVITTDPRVVFITANLTHNRIVKFPQNNGDYWDPLYKDFVTPAAYVRASMSLPFIFHSFIPDNRHVQLPAGAPTPENAVHLPARLVDGGMLSNFPIREFHVPAPGECRYPTFGVLLGAPSIRTQSAEDALRDFRSISVFKYILSFVSTFRNFYDADFLANHKELKLIVKPVDTSEFNSLDFAMSDETKRKLFKAGARTAVAQLEQFNWNEYQIVRNQQN
ncbi:MAG: hypothetical protein EOO05_13655 [Chitinophagaceae bacterium]|nr:MAG: hypothetical protein EOO05_13655 [Chitinophagaceae bacterium]